MPVSRFFAGWCSVALPVFSLVATASAKPADTTASQKTVVCVEGTNCAHVYIAGDRSLTLLTDEIAVTVRIGQLENPSHYTVAVIEVTNHGKQPFDVLPAAFTLEQLRPKPKVLRYVPPEKVEKRINRWMPWHNYFLANEAAHATKVVSTTDSTTAAATTGATTGSVTINGPDGMATGRYSGSSDANTTLHTTSTTTVPDLQRRASDLPAGSCLRKASCSVANPDRE